MIQNTDCITSGTMTHREDGSAHDTADLVTDEQIEALRTDAGAAGDFAQVRLCARALRGDRKARRECARALQAAAAMKDE